MRNDPNGEDWRPLKPESTTAEIREALETMRPFMFPGLYDQLNAQLSARENQWPMPQPPPFAADDEDDEAPDE